MARIDIPDDLYPELLMAALRDEIRREERVTAIRDAARRRRRARWAALMASIRRR